jgi:opacity protein-like surface antigen
MGLEAWPTVGLTFTFPPILAGNGTVPFPSSSAAFGASKTNVGFSVGGGIEGSVWLPANWTWELEYLYLDLGSLNVVTSFTQPSIPNVPSTSPVTGTIATHAHFTDNIVRVGLNYKFH